MAAYNVCMDVRFEDVADTQSGVVCRIDVVINVAVWINDECLAV